MRCDHCGKLKRKFNFNSIPKNYKNYRTGGTTHKYNIVCPECNRQHYARCHACGYRQVKEQFVEINLGRGGPHQTVSICSHCNENHKCTCYQCQEQSWDFVGENLGNSDDPIHFCAKCSELRRPIQDHQYKPTVQHFHAGSKEGKVTKNALHFGFELEVEQYYSSVGRTAMAEMVKDRFTTDYVYIVHDGSIDNGIEVVSHPFTWEEYKENIDKWNDLLLFMRSKQWKADRPKVGFHVHMTKAAFTTFHLFKFLRFFYKKSNRKFILDIAGRAPTYHSVFSEEDRSNIVANAKDKANRDASHYNAVNLNNSDTIEIRMFKGTLEPVLFNKNIEFLHAVFEYTKNHNPASMTAEQFIKYVYNHRRKYPCLWDYLLNTKGIREESKLCV
jgi:hypothetical protein